MRWPPLARRPSATHVAIIVLHDDGEASYVVAAVGTSDDLDLPRVSVDWRKAASSRWVRGWPSGSGVTHFYKRNVQQVPRRAIVRETEAGTGRIGSVPSEVVDRIVLLF